MNNQVFYTLCPRCGKEIRAGVKFCPHCAASFASEIPGEMVCPSCGKVAPKGEKFCSDCGHAYAPKQGSAPMQAVHTPVVPRKMVVQAPAKPNTAYAERDTTQEGFFAKYAGRYTKGWAKWLPIFGVISAVVYLVLMIVMFVNANAISSAFMLIDVLCVGGLSVVMMKSKKAIWFIAFAVYNGIASVLAFIDMDFSNLLWLAASVYLAVKVYKVEKAYNDYLRTGTLPQEEI